MSKPVLLAAGDAVAATGFSRVMHRILEPLQHVFEIHQLAVNFHGDPSAIPWRLYPAAIGGEPFGVNRIADLVARLRPQLVLMVNDIWILGDYMDRLRDRLGQFRTVMYCPVDAGPVDVEHVARLDGVDRFVAYTEYGRRHVQAALERLRREGRAIAFPEIELIPHGVDTDIFQPYREEDVGVVGSPSQHEALRLLFGRDAPELADAFIVLNANRNQPRKRVDVTLRGFARFAAGKPDVRLHLHMGVEDSGWNVMKLSKQLDIDEQIILTTSANSLPSVPDEQLNAIYNAAAVGVNTALAEGWGLVSFEHAAAGAAQVVPRHSACEELWDGHALLLEPATWITMDRQLGQGGIVSAEALAEALERLYADRELLRTMSLAARANALRPEYRWPAIAARWGELLTSTL